MRKKLGLKMRSISVSNRRRNVKQKHWKIDCRRRVLFLRDFYKEDEAIESP